MFGDNAHSDNIYPEHLPISINIYILLHNLMPMIWIQYKIMSSYNIGAFKVFHTINVDESPSQFNTQTRWSGECLF